jgi:hypothetical protein
MQIRPCVRGAIALTLVAWTTLSLLHGQDANPIEARMRKDITYLASDECEGRGVGTKGLDLAADYIAKQFAASGLKPGGVDGGWFQPFPFVTSSELDGASALTLKGPNGQTIELKQGTDYQLFGLSGGGKVSAPLVFVGYGATAPSINYDDYKGIDVAGKVVVLIRRAPRWNSKEMPFDGKRKDEHAALENKLGLAEANKAAAVLLVNDGTEVDAGDPLSKFETTAKAPSNSSVPFVHLKRAVLDDILRSSTGASLVDTEKAIDRDLKSKSAELKGWSITLDAKVKRKADMVKNVIGVLEGSGPLANETIVIGAHYDHLGYGGRGSRDPKNKAIHHGADDNGSGTTAVLELSRRFGAMKGREGRRLVFMTFTAEEMGLIGSRFYTKRQPLFAIKDTAAMVNLDMVGRLRPDPTTKKEKVLVEGSGTAKTFDALLDKYNPGFQLSKKPGGNGPSDHDSFYNVKVPVIFLWTGLHEEYHKPTDTSDKINVDGMRRITDYAEKIIAELATDKDRPVYVEVAGSFTPGGGGPKGPRLGIAPDYEEDKKGVVVGSVSKDGPAEKGGIQKGDLIVEIAGKAVTNINTYMAIMGQQKSGQPLEIGVLRDGKKLQLKVVPQ